MIESIYLIIIISNHYQTYLKFDCEVASVSNCVEVVRYIMRKLIATLLDF